VAIALTIACGVALAALLVAEHRQSKPGKLATKPLASGAFIALAVVLGDPTSTGSGQGFAAGGYSTWILIGLVLGAAGDIALIFPRGFAAGLALFLLGHLAYIAACAQLVAPADWPSYPALAPIACGAGALLWLWPNLGKLRVPVILYVAAISAMVVAALAVGDTILTAGALLFFASDLAVARNRFVAPGFTNRAWGLPAYYAGQLLFAWTLS